MSTPELTTIATQTPTATATRDVQPTATPGSVSGVWRREYFADPDLEGQSALVRTDGEVGFGSRDGTPAPGLPTTGFSVRWSRVATFEQGLEFSYAPMDNGMRASVDEELL